MILKALKQGRSLQEAFNRDFHRETSHLLGSVDCSTIDDQAGVLKVLQERAIREKKSLFLVVRRGAPLERVLDLKRRESKMEIFKHVEK